MTCGLEPVEGRTRQEFELLEDEVASCDAAFVGYFRCAEALHRAACELLEQGLSPDSNVYFLLDGRAIYSLWHYPVTAL